MGEHNIIFTFLCILKKRFFKDLWKYFLLTNLLLPPGSLKIARIQESGLACMCLIIIFFSFSVVTTLLYQVRNHPRNSRCLLLQSVFQLFQVHTMEKNTLRFSLMFSANSSREIHLDRSRRMCLVKYCPLIVHWSCPRQRKTKNKTPIACCECLSETYKPHSTWRKIQDNAWSDRTDQKSTSEYQQYFSIKKSKNVIACVWVSK